MKKSEVWNCVAKPGFTIVSEHQSNQQVDLSHRVDEQVTNRVFDVCAIVQKPGFIEQTASDVCSWNAECWLTRQV